MPLSYGNIEKPVRITESTSKKAFLVRLTWESCEPLLLDDKISLSPAYCQ